MGKIHPPPGVKGPTLDVQVLEGLESYIATEDFLHKLEQASAEWIDLSEHQHPPSCAWPHEGASDGTQGSQDQQRNTATADAATSDSAANPDNRSSSSSSSCSSSSKSLLSRWTSSAPRSSASTVQTGRGSNSGSGAGSTESSSSCAAPAAADPVAGDVAGDVAVVTSFEVVEQQAPLHQDMALQEPFVLVSSEDAIEGMAYYIALYLSRAPEARYMEPKQLQAALRQTFTAIRRSRYRVVFDWGRWLYRWGAVSYSALQLYEHPWLVRAVVAAIWTSSKMALGFLW